MLHYRKLGSRIYIILKQNDIDVVAQKCWGIQARKYMNGNWSSSRGAPEKGLEFIICNFEFEFLD